MGLKVEVLQYPSEAYSTLREPYSTLSVTYSTPKPPTFRSSKRTIPNHNLIV